MKHILSLTSINIFLIALLVIFGSYIRLSYLGTHFSHIDDILVAKSIFNPPEQDIQSCKAKYYDVSHKKYNTIQWKLLRKAESFGFLDIYIGIKNYQARLFPCSLTSTYAPIQPFITQFFIDKKLSYSDLLYRGRLPSFIFSILGVFSLIYFYKIINKKWATTDALFALTLLVCSWQCIIYSMQMEPYILIILGIYVYYTVLVFFIDNPISFLDKSEWYGCLLAFLPYLHYQLVFLLPAFLSTLFLVFYKNKYIKPFLYIKKIVSFFIPIIVSYFILFTLFLSSMQGGVNWNAGPLREFLFDFKQLLLPDGWLYITNFLIKNLFCVYSTILSFVPEDTAVYFFIYLFVLCIIGTVSLFLSKNTKKNYMGVFGLLYFFTHILFVICGKISLSPTRHSMVLIPFFIMHTVEGWRYTLDLFFKKKYIVSLFMYIPAFMIISMFFIGLKPLLLERKDCFNEAFIFDICNQYKPKMVVCTDWTEHAVFMPSVFSRFCVISMDAPGVLRSVSLHQKGAASGIFNHFNEESDTIIFISHRTKTEKDNFERSLSEINSITSQFTINPFFESYFLLKKIHLPSDVQICFSRKTSNGSNAIYVDIFKEKVPICHSKK